MDVQSGSIVQHRVLTKYPGSGFGWWTGGAGCTMALAFSGVWDVVVGVIHPLPSIRSFDVLRRTNA